MGKHISGKQIFYLINMGQTYRLICFNEVKPVTTKSMLVNPANIQTYYHEQSISKTLAEQIIEAENSKKSRVITLVAEEVSKGEYILIEKFEYYSALMKIKPYYHIPCLVYPATSEKERLLHILKVSIPLEKAWIIGWLFKNKHVLLLMENHQMTINEIAAYTNQSPARIRSFLRDERIPIEIWEEALKVNAKTVVEKVASNTVIPKQIKTILYKRAVLPKSYGNRLTGKKFEYMKDFFTKEVISGKVLKDERRLERMVDSMLYDNFNLKGHFNNLFNSFFLNNGHYHLKIPVWNRSDKRK